jgi:superfamily II DNA or RNA helicase
MERLNPTGFTRVDSKVARATIARLILDESDSETGSVILHPHQLSAVARIRAAIDEFGGALLSDPAGTGKTYAALAACARTDSVLVTAPAVLRAMWTEAARAADRTITFVSHESLSRGRLPEQHFSFLIVDEAHHARNPSARRYTMLSRLATGASVLLLSATPIHNRRRDLVALLAIFLGVRAEGLTKAELGRCVIRRENMESARPSLPRTGRLIWCSTPENDALPRMLLGLPPPLPPRDGGDGGALVAHSLVRQWASSDAALAAGLVRRLHRAAALISALEDGTWPSKAELRTWIAAEDSVQLAFSALLSPPAGDTSQLLSTIRAHRDGIAHILAALRTDTRADAARAALIRRIRAAHRDKRIVAFSQYAATVEVLFHLLAQDGEIAALTGTNGRVAGGKISRAEVIERFAPEASGRSAPRRAETVSLLLTTDILSEGVNLQDAAVVIHLDLPWTPARMEQRLGRIARIGSRHAEVHSYAVRPPASAEAIVRLDAILREKMSAAGILMTEFKSLAGLSSTMAGERNEPALMEASRNIISRWLSEDGRHDDGKPLVASVIANRSGFLAVCMHNHRMQLVACLDGVITEDPAVVLECVRLCDSVPATTHAQDFTAAMHALFSWMIADSSMAGAAASAVGRSQARSRALRRISAASRHARPHARARISSLARRAREAVTGGFGIHAEGELERISAIASTDEQWLENVIEFGESARVKTSRSAADVGTIHVLMVFSDAIALTPATER